ncbi:MAG: biotin synthase BioB [Phycisphaerae bacterium]|nr:biotin synthase BioB [Phycisphaerae bacterium]
MPEDTAGVLAKQVLSGTPLSRDEAEVLAGLPRSALPMLFAWAHRIRLHFVGAAVKCCSIVSAKTGACTEDCAFCSQAARRRNAATATGSLDPNDVVSAADDAARNGASSFGIVASGLGPTDLEIDRWADAASRIRGTQSLSVCASLGVVTDAQARRLADAGVQRYNHNLQTSRRHFPTIIGTHAYDDRLNTLKTLKRAGMSVCSGGLFGMGETWSDRLDLAFELRALGVDVVPLNFLIAIDGTPLAGTQPLPPMECLQIIALFRFLLPEADIKVAGGREPNLRELQSWIFLAGANSFIVGNYLTTCGRPATEDFQLLRDLELPLECDGASVDLAKSSTTHA